MRNPETSKSLIDEQQLSFDVAALSKQESRILPLSMVQRLSDNNPISIQNYQYHPVEKMLNDLGREEKIGNYELPESPRSPKFGSPFQRIETPIKCDKSTFSQRMKINKLQLRSKFQYPPPNIVPPILPPPIPSVRSKSNISGHSMPGAIPNNPKNTRRIEQKRINNRMSEGTGSPMISASPHFLEQALIEQSGDSGYLKELSVFGPSTTSHTPRLHPIHLSLDATRRPPHNSHIPTERSINREHYTIEYNGCEEERSEESQGENEYKHKEDISGWEDEIDDTIPGLSIQFPPIKVNISKRLPSPTHQTHRQEYHRIHPINAPSPTTKVSHLGDGYMYIAHPGFSGVHETGPGGASPHPHPHFPIQKYTDENLNNTKGKKWGGRSLSHQPCRRCLSKLKNYKIHPKNNYNSIFRENDDELAIEAHELSMKEAEQDLESGLNSKIHTPPPELITKKILTTNIEEIDKYPQLKKQRTRSRLGKINNLSEYIQKLIIKNQSSRKKARKEGMTHILEQATIDLSAVRDHAQFLTETDNRGRHKKSGNNVSGEYSRNTHRKLPFLCNSARKQGGGYFNTNKYKIVRFQDILNSSDLVNSQDNKQNADIEHVLNTKQ